MRLWWQIVACALALAWPAGNAVAAEPEGPPTFDAAKIPGIKPAGVNYTILNPVRSDGFLRNYLLKTPFGDVPVTSDAMLQARIRELAAVHELDQVSQSDAFNRALGEAGIAPIKYAGNIIINPIQTLGQHAGRYREHHEPGRLRCGQCGQDAGSGLRRTWR